MSHLTLWIMNETLSHLSHCIIPTSLPLSIDSIYEDFLVLFQDSRKQQRDAKILQFLLLFKKAACTVVNFVSFASLCFVVSVPLLQLQCNISVNESRLSRLHSNLQQNLNCKCK